MMLGLLQQEFLIIPVKDQVKLPKQGSLLTPWKHIMPEEFHVRALRENWIAVLCFPIIVKNAKMRNTIKDILEERCNC